MARVSAVALTICLAPWLGSSAVLRHQEAVAHRAAWWPFKAASDDAVKSGDIVVPGEGPIEDEALPYHPEEPLPPLQRPGTQVLLDSSSHEQQEPMRAPNSMLPSAAFEWSPVAVSAPKASTESGPVVLSETGRQSHPMTLMEGQCLQFMQWAQEKGIQGKQLALLWSRTCAPVMKSGEVTAFQRLCAELPSKMEEMDRQPELACTFLVQEIAKADPVIDPVMAPKAPATPAPPLPPAQAPFAPQASPDDSHPSWNSVAAAPAEAVAVDDYQDTGAPAGSWEMPLVALPFEAGQTPGEYQVPGLTNQVCPGCATIPAPMRAPRDPP